MESALLLAALVVTQCGPAGCNVARGPVSVPYYAAPAPAVVYPRPYVTTLVPRQVALPPRPVARARRGLLPRRFR